MCDTSAITNGQNPMVNLIIPVCGYFIAVDSGKW